MCLYVHDDPLIIAFKKKKKILSHEKPSTKTFHSMLVITIHSCVLVPFLLHVTKAFLAV